MKDGTAISCFRYSSALGPQSLGVAGDSSSLLSSYRLPHTSVVCSELAAVIAVLMISWILLLQIFRSTAPTTVVSIQGAIAVYLLFGLAWANAYLIVMQLNPHSFQSTVGLSSSSATEWYYYSYVTLTTLGYGRNYAANQDCTCDGRRRSCHGTTLSRCFNCAIDWHGDHLLATKNALKGL